MVFFSKKRAAALLAAARKIPDIIQIELFVVMNNISEARLQGSAANMAAIDVRLSEQLSCVAAVYRTAVKDANFFSNLCTVKLNKKCTDPSANFLSLI